MKTLQNNLTAAGSFLLAIAVMIGAFGSTALVENLSTLDLYVFRNALLFHFVHAVALLLLKNYTRTRGGQSKYVKWVGLFFFFGIIFFCFPFYILSVSQFLFNERMYWLEALTFFGGTLLIAGWLTMGTIAAVANFSKRA